MKTTKQNFTNNFNLKESKIKVSIKRLKDKKKYDNLIKINEEIYNFLKENKVDLCESIILDHQDVFKDKNGNFILASQPYNLIAHYDEVKKFWNDLGLECLLMQEYTWYGMGTTLYLVGNHDAIESVKKYIDTV